MSVDFRRNRMISFRLTHDDYDRFAKMCSERGVRSISDMARTALQRLVAEDDESDPVSFQVRALRGQVKTLAHEVERLAETVEGRKAIKEANG
jgi:hypothetical protein